MRVLHVITGLDAGGAEQWLRSTLRHSTADAQVCSLTGPGVLGPALAAEGVRVHALGMRGNRDLAALPRLVRLIRAGRFDLVHTHLYRAQVYGALAARLAGVRAVVSTEHSLNDRLIEGRPVDRPGVRGLYRAAARLTTRTVAVSEPVAVRLAAWGIDPARVEVVPVGVDTAAFAFDPAARAAVRAALGVDEATTLVGGLCRLVAAKRVDVLVQALAPLPDTALVLVGDGAARAEIAALAAALGMAGRVHLVGQRLDVARWLSAMDVLASPSPEETFGVALLEGLAAGLPVVYAAAPALDRLPPSGALVRAAATPEAFREALTALRGRPRATRPAARSADYDVAALTARLDGIHRASVEAAAARFGRRPGHG